jgi:F-type H+-transporting ATPase subunit c
MKRVQLVGLAAVAVLLVLAAPAFAQAPSSTSVLSGGSIGAGLGAAITIIGAGYGFGRIGAAALESMARQPEVAGRILPAMIVIAALLEGATFFALLICYLLIQHITDKGSW